MPPTTTPFRNAWTAIVIAMAVLALPAFAQDPKAAQPAGAQTQDAAAVPATDAAPADAAPADASAPTDATAAAPADSPEVAVTGEPPADTRALDETVQDLKKDVVDLNKELFVLEEELLFPANTQVALFVSMDVGKMFQLDSVQVKLDDKVVANYLYTALEVEALHRGGVQRVYLGNLKNGQHELVAFFTGKGPHERDYRRGANVKFEKTGEAKYIELRIQDSAGKLQPEFDVKLWQ